MSGLIRGGGGVHTEGMDIDISDEITADHTLLMGSWESRFPGICPSSSLPFKTRYTSQPSPRGKTPL